MKHSLLLAALFAMLSLNAFAKKVTITVADFTFSPATTTLKLGDTVVFTWSSGTHTTTSTSVPVNAIPWDSPITSTQTSFTYVPTFTGVYSYVCTPHASMGMTGSFTVQNPTSVPVVANSALFSFWPNPATSNTHIRFNDVQSNITVSVTDITGTIVMSRRYVNTQETDIDIANLPDGRYILYATNGHDIYAQHLLVQ